MLPTFCKWNDVVNMMRNARFLRDSLTFLVNTSDVFCFFGC